MRKEDFFEMLGELDDDIVKEAKTPLKNKINWRIWRSMAACLCLVVVGALVIQNAGAEPDMGVASPQPDSTTGTNIIQSNNDPEVSMPANNNPEISMPEKKNFLVINELDRLSSADMDVEYSSYEKIPYHVWKKILENFHEFTGISYEDFIARVPDTWEYVNFYSLAIRGYKDAYLSAEYRLHDYVFDYRTADGGKARIALCSLEEPLRDYFIYCDNPERSEINGVPIVIYGFNDLFMAGFSYENVNYDIETRGIELEELEELLSCILAVSEPVPGDSREQRAN